MRNSQDNPQSPGAQPAGKSLGMGGEAAENFHAEQQNRAGGSPDAAAASQQNAADTGRGRDAGGADRAGSEPLSREREHVPSYGGMGGVPRISSDQREPADPEGDANVARGEGGPPPTRPAGSPAHGAPGGQADESDPAYPTPS
jgi:hypothetical protein